MTKNKTIKILGAGVSGLSAAINLAKAGYEVEVFERKNDAGARFYGDLQGLENYSEKGNILDWLDTVNIEQNFHCKALPPLKALDGKGFSADFEFKRPLCYLVKRGVMHDSLDQGLKRQALASDAYRMKTDRTGFDNLFITGDWIDCDLNMGCVEATVISGLMCATGVRKSYGLSTDAIMIDL